MNTDPSGEFLFQTGKGRILFGCLKFLERSVFSLKDQSDIFHPVRLHSGCIVPFIDLSFIKIWFKPTSLHSKTDCLIVPHSQFIIRNRSDAVIQTVLQIQTGFPSGEKLYSERYGETSDYTRKGGVICSEIFLPANAPPEFANRQTLWNSLEAAEKNKNAQLAYSYGGIEMNDKELLEQNPQPDKEDVSPEVQPKIGRTTFLVKLHFKEDGTETLKDKVKSLIRKDVENGNF